LVLFTEFCLLQLPGKMSGAEGSEGSKRERDALHPDEQQKEKEPETEVTRAELEQALVNNQALADSVAGLKEELAAMKLKMSGSGQSGVTSERPQFRFADPPKFTGEGKHDVRAWVRSLESYLVPCRMTSTP
jgi:hypothetical protein